MATTSNGRSRRLSLCLVSAAALAAAALHRAAGPHTGPAPDRRSRPVSATAWLTTQEVPTPAVSVRTLRDRAISAEAIERALIDATPAARDALLQRMLEAWVELDAPAAARFAELQGDPFLREVGLRTVAQRWAGIDADSAARWAAAIGDAAARGEAIDQVALTLADSDPRAALDLLTRFGEARHQGHAFAGVIMGWAGRDFDAAQSWVDALPPDGARDAIGQRLTFLRAQTDPAAAMQIASDMFNTDEARRDAYVSIIRPWVEQDAESARAWIASADAETRRRVEAELATTPKY